MLRHVPDAGSRTSLAVVFRAVPELDPAYMSALVTLLRVLDDSMSTRLHYTLADQKGLAYSVHAAIEPLADAALFEITSATANAKVPALIKELFVLLDGLRAGNIHADELAKARVRYRYTRDALAHRSTTPRRLPKLVRRPPRSSLHPPPRLLIGAGRDRRSHGPRTWCRSPSRSWCRSGWRSRRVGTMSKARLGELDRRC